MTYIDRFEVPESLGKWTDHCRVQPINIGESGAEVYFMEHETKENFYLKRQPAGWRETLAAEMDKMVWLDGKLPVPRVLGFAANDGYEYLLMSEVEGRTGADTFICEHPEEFLPVIARGLRMIHAVDPSFCPFDERLPVKMAEAQYRARNGLVHEKDFDAIWQGYSADRLYTELVAVKPTTEDLVFTHGDYCMPNIIIKNGEISGFIDWGRAGISDRYQDLALAARSIVRNYGKEWIPLFFEAYGLEKMDEAKVSFYQLLDEFY